MSEVLFKPWIGSKYEEGINGKRVMILGHNHYCDERTVCDRCPVQDCLNLTTEIVEQYLKNPIPDSDHRWKVAYNAFERAMCGKTPSEDERIDLWDHLLFYNLVQEAMPTPDTKPYAKQYSAALDPFRTVLEQFEPDVIFAWGNGAYNHTPNDGGSPISQIIFEKCSAIGWRYLNYSKPIDIFKIRHPSRSFSWRMWHEIVMKVLNSEYDVG